MTDYHYQLVERRGDTCLHVLIDHADEDGIARTHIPLKYLEASIARYRAEQEQEQMGKPSKGTPKDMRLKVNNPNVGKSKPVPPKKGGKP